MGKSLFIVESPTKAKTIAHYLGKDFEVTACTGHIKDLPKSSLGVDIENDFTPELQIIPGKGKLVSTIRKMAQNADIVYLASDPDREGEAIAWHLAEEIGAFTPNGVPVKRILMTAITKEGIKKAMENPQEIDRGKYESQLARRILDRLVGYKISPILWDKVRRGLSAGRVQSVALRLVTDREKQIRAFVAEEYWSVKAVLSPEKKSSLEAQLILANDEKIVIPDEKTARLLVEESRQSPFVVKEVLKTAKSRKPAPPFTTSTLQQEAARKCRFTIKRTMMIAQKLFEGIEIGSEGAVGLITYMRTDSVRVADEAVAECRNLIEKMYGREMLPPKPQVYKTNKNAQDAHEAIHPTSVQRTPESLKPYLTPEQLKLYRLIWQRFVASQMANDIVDLTQINIQNGRLTYRATGSILRFAGFRAVYIEGSDEAGDKNDEKDTLLPDVREGRILECLGIEPKQHFTQPPNRFTEGSIIKEIEKRRIGRPSTYDTIISLLTGKDYVEKENAHLVPTELGMLVSDLLVANFPDILDVEFTAQMESELDKIVEGKTDRVRLLNDFYSPFSQALNKAENEMKNVKQETRDTDLVCDKCGKMMVIKWGKNGYFLTCSAYPDCKNAMEFITDQDGKIIPCERKEEIVGNCDKCGSPMLLKVGKFGRFLACSAYPKCKHTKAFSLGIHCPACQKGEILEKRSKKGKIFYSCSAYPECKFATWNKPLDTPCPMCGHMTEEVVKKDSKSRMCSSCGYFEEINE